MSSRAERLLEEYAEAKLALMNRVPAATGEGRRSSDDDYDDADDSATHRSSRSNRLNSRGRNTRSSSAVNSNAGRKSHTVSHSSSWCREIPASSRAPIRHSVQENSASQENPVQWENRGKKPAAKQSKCSRDRSPLGTINQSSNLLILGQHILPPLPAERFHQRRGRLDN